MSTLNIMYSKSMIFFLFVHKYIYCVYSLEVPLQGASNENSQHMYSKSMIFFLFVQEYIYCGYLLEVPLQGAQHI